MRVDDLLSRLDKVKKTGNGKWSACCPAHQDKSPSLRITEKPDELILIHCFAECENFDILAAVDMEFSDLFPEKLADHIKPLRKPFPAADVLEALANETLIVYIAAKRLANGESLSIAELDRLRLASERIMAAINLVNG